MLSLNWGLLFIVINILVLYVFLKKFLFGKVIGIINKRQELINKQLEDASKAKEDAEELLEKHRKSVEAARAEGDSIIDGAKERAGREYKRIVDDADEKAAKIISRAKEEARLEKEKSMRDMQDKIAELAVEAASKMIGNLGGEENDLKLYDKFLSKAGETHDPNDEQIH